ncbi:hypothetical protein [Methylobacterium sp. PvR107]|uniref:hypothetical protein n=1 Tax=Methylobacterium sp. PvR107 TaxID=2806597 RepID=UPI001AE67EA9|nr:hypothetical protein [Methylobacterium sp. PvR107]MBP1182913.1 hypothetical protein [Methylobacterium sp. PvR107]
MANLDALFDRTGGGYWKSRSDDELLQTQFTTDDPESLESVSDDPPPDEEATVELAYDVAGRDAGRAQCVFCRYPNHDKGVVMLFRSGQRRLVGRDCARKHYGVAFDAMARDFDAAQDRASYVERQRRAVSERHDIVALLRAMRADPAIREFSDTRRRLRDFMGPKLWPRFERMADQGEILGGGPATALRNGQLTILIGSSRPGGIAGADLVRTGPSVAQRLEAIEAELETVIAGLRGAGNATREIRSGLVRLVELLKAVEAERVRMRSVTAFFEDANLGRVAHWMRSFGRNGVAVDVLPYRLVDDHARSECGPPKDYTIPGKSLVAAMREAVVLAPQTKRRRAA